MMHLNELGQTKKSKSFFKDESENPLLKELVKEVLDLFSVNCDYSNQDLNLKAFYS